MPRAKANAQTTADITSLLHEDHQKVRNLFFDFHNTDDESEKENLVKQILTELFIHSTVEEEIVYPAVEEEADDAQDLVDEAENEHRVVKFIMAELSNMSATDDQYDAKVTVLCEMVGHHIKEEEKEMFKKLRESGADLEDLAKQVEVRKEELKGEPLPAMNCSISIGEEEQEEGKKSPSRMQPKAHGAKQRRSA